MVQRRTFKNIVHLNYTRRDKYLNITFFMRQEFWTSDIKMKLTINYVLYTT